MIFFRLFLSEMDFFKKDFLFNFKNWILFSKIEFCIKKIFFSKKMNFLKKIDFFSKIDFFQKLIFFNGIF